jgi:glutathione synthase/RimK-type ligase-like ATP-grasp enzyme
MILCLTHSNDLYTIDIVMKRLKELGKEAYRMNSDLFSSKLSFDYSLSDNKNTVQIQIDDRVIDANAVEAVWYRKLWQAEAPDELDDDFKEIYLQEYYTMQNIFFESLRDVPWFNPMAKDHEISNNKFGQLSVAAQNSIEIPKSLFTNNQEQVKAFFYEECNKQMIAKLHGTLSRSMLGNTPFFPTTQITEPNLVGLAALIYCPMIFQEMIPKAYELRIIYVDGEFFAGKINAGQSERGKTDWRIATDIYFKWEPYKLPDQVATSLSKMMQQMGLFFGAIDMIRHQDGRYIFLEVNPQGEWGMLQRDLSYPIGETIAEKLVARLE